ncbi:MAG TPA: diaminopimelate decarboxylase [Acidimicrobiales bacterium]|nr:diaminopimelate decarboxylase [Acidimicrobiales bacterium]
MQTPFTGALEDPGGREALAHAQGAPSPDEGPVGATLLPITASVGAGGRLSVGGVDLVALADELGTPLFVYDEAHLRNRCREAVGAWGEGVAYATKAFLCRAVAALAHEEGMWLDVSTAGEMHVALAAGVPASRLVLHGNNKSDVELSGAVESGVGRIVVDSFDEIDRLAGLVNDARAATVLVRVTPGVEAHTHEFVRTGQEDSKFGFGLSSGAAAEAVERLRAVRGVRLVGIHAHIGSQVFRVESFAEEVEVLAKFFTPLGLPELCVGGGLGVPYVAREKAPSIAEWARSVHDACGAAGIAGSTRVTAEPGRAIVATAGLTLYRVGTVKELRGIRTYLAVDGGMSDNPRPVLYGSGYEAFLPRATDAPRPRAVRVVGKHCEAGDVVVADARVPEDVAVGDVLATPVTGAYGYAMASNYNKVPRPAVVFVADGRYRVVVRREDEDDLLRLDA